MITHTIRRIAKPILGEYYTRRVKELCLTPGRKKDLQNRMSLYRLFINPGELVFDIGANYGNRVEPLLKIGANIVAVEPQLNCIHYLRKKYNRDIVTVHKGVSNNSGWETLLIADSNVLSSFSSEWIESVQNTGRFSKNEWSKSEKIEMTTLDMLIEQYGKPKFIKIDVEGYEFKVLKGLSQKIPFISFEYAMPETKDTIIQIMNYLNNLYNKSIKFNYSIGESMNLELDEWLNFDNFRQLLDSPNFNNSQFGDIYTSWGRDNNKC